MVFLCVIYIALNLLTNNFHTVISDEVYRSAQLNAIQLAYYKKEYHIKSIVNLRGYQPQDKWYRQEVAYAHKNGLHYYNLKLPAHELPLKEKLQKLVYILQTAPKPLLVHCKYGADRSGLAAAISVILSGNKSLDAMQDQISWQYNVLSPVTIGYQVMRNYLFWLRQHTLSYGEKSFMYWLNNVKSLKRYSGIYFT